MKPVVFVDTAGWLALVNTSDNLHKNASNIRNELFKDNAQLVTTNQVIIEVANAMSKLHARMAAVELIDSIQRSENVEIVFTDPILFHESWSFYKNRMDKEWSLTDCVSFVVMRQQKITSALTSDRHFEQAGFKILLKQ